MRSRSKRVLLISGHSMFGRGIESLLVNTAGIELIGLENDIRAGVDFINRCRPDVVIINCENPDIDYSPAFNCLLRERLGICLICLDLGANRIYIYRGEHKQVQRVEDLLQVIRE